MEATATATRRDGSPGPSSSRWTYQRLQQMGSYTVSSSSRSGTIVSTAYTSGAASRSSLSAGLELKIHLSWDQRTKEQGNKTREEQERMKRVVELVHGGVKGWFTELEVAWVLDLDDDAFVREIQRTGRPWDWVGLHAPTWINALAEIVETIRFTQTHATPNQFFLWRVTSKILQTVKSKLFFTNEIVNDDGASIPDQVQFARFAQVAMLKMLAFVDVDVYRLYGIPEIYRSLNLLLGVHGVLSKALHVIDVLLISSPPGKVESIMGEISGLLSTKKEKALRALCLTLNRTTTDLLEWIEDLSAAPTLQQSSSDIHEVTRSVISHISFLMHNKLSLDLIISEADYNFVSKKGDYRIILSERFPAQTRSDFMIIRMALHLQEELASLSETFPDQGLRFLFLLNNSHQLHQCLRSVGSSLQFYLDFTKVNDYMQSYLQVSWAPVLSCLFNPSKRVMGENYSPLTRFESKFQETYITQKHWKVPDPAVRKNLRTAITEQIIPGYTKYIKENNITTPGLAPQELEKMLQDLFEG